MTSRRMPRRRGLVVRRAIGPGGPGGVIVSCVAEFVRQCCAIETSASETAASLGSAIESWCVATGRRPIARSTLGRCLSRLGFRRKHGSAVIWHGLRLRYASGDGIPAAPPVDTKPSQLPPILKIESFGLEKPLKSASSTIWAALVAEFITARCDLDPLSFEAAADLWADYRAWSSARGLREVSQTAFGRQLRAMGFRSRKGKQQWWDGLRLRRHADQQPVAPQPPPVAQHASQLPPATPIDEFLAAACLRDPGWFEQAGDLWATYLAWCCHRGESAVTQTAFGRSLKAAGFQNRCHRVVFWFGIRLAEVGGSQSMVENKPSPPKPQSTSTG